MATATAVDLSLTDCALSIQSNMAEYSSPMLEQTAEHWSHLLREELNNLFQDRHISETVYDAPRRKDPDTQKAGLAVSIAALLYPAPSDSVLGPLIKYKKDIVLLRRAIVKQRQAACAPKPKFKPTWIERIHAQGPWDEVNDPLSLKGLPALPMPVRVSHKNTLEPFFEQLRIGGTYEDGKAGKEEHYSTEMGEWKKGILYKDGRMDLCKMVVGPPHIDSLMTSLETNPFVRHFLLGNNLIGPAGATRIAHFLSQHKNIETWYLAGNCIDAKSFELLVDGFLSSPAITNIWLKRNPLRPGSASLLYSLITNAPKLRTLDLDQTKLGDAGVAELFSNLAGSNAPILPLRNIYLNGNGISLSACESIAAFLASSNCNLQSLYISNNPVGDSGAIALATGLQYNKTLLRLSARSCGLKSAGGIALMDALASHPCIMTLDICHSFSTDDLGMRYNWFDDAIYASVINLIATTKTLQYLDLGISPFSLPVVERIYQVVAQSTTLLVFKAWPLANKSPKSLRRDVLAHLTANVQTLYGKDITYEAFQQGEQRWLISPKDVRLIDSSYRNRDMGLARRGEKILDKWWADEEELERVMRGEADGGW